MQSPFLHPGSSASASDQLAERLRGAARSLLVLVCGLFPILFIPSAYMPLSSGKTMILAAAVALAVLLYVLSVLREGSLSIRLPLPILGLWLIAAATAVSAALSGDLRDAFFGDGLDSYTVAFTVLLAATATAMGIFGRSQSSVMRLYIVLIGSGLVLSLFHVARLLFGPEALSFGLWNSATVSPIGSWNGLAIFYGLVVLLSLLALQQLPITRVGRYIVIGVIALSLLMLSVINFSTVWWVLAFVAGSIMIYHLAKNLWSAGDRRSDSDPWHSLVAALMVILFSLVFIIGGARLSGAITDRLGVGFIEVRPSAAATMNIGRDVYRQDLLLGSGPNRFADVWRLHKDPAINQTIFWNARFDSGYSYVATAVIGTGLIGLLAWSFFLLAFAWSGLRFVLRSSNLDRFWHFIGISSLAASIYFWCVSLLYVPPPSVLLLAAITTGIFMVAYARTSPGKALALSVEKNRGYGFILIVLAVLVVTGSGYGLYAASRQVTGTYAFNKVVANASEGSALVDIEAGIASAFELSRNDAFAHGAAFYRWSEMRSLLSVPEPGPDEQQAFQNAAARAIQAAQLAVALDPTDPYNHQILGQVFALLAFVGVEGASDRALEAYREMRRYDPHSPVSHLLEADLALQSGDAEAARSAAEEAVRLRPNHTEALFLLAQLDINDGNVDRALVIVNGLAQLEPQNPARRYQLGILLASAERLDEAVSAFEQAVALDPQYANARYFLALGYAEQGRVDAAIEQLTIVRSLNESNAVVDDLIDQLRTQGSISANITEQDPVPERSAESGNVTDRDLESGLVTSSNPVPPSAVEENAVTE